MWRIIGNDFAMSLCFVDDFVGFVLQSQRWKVVHTIVVNLVLVGWVSRLIRYWSTREDAFNPLYNGNRDTTIFVVIIIAFVITVFIFLLFLFLLLVFFRITFFFIFTVFILLIFYPIFSRLFFVFIIVCLIIAMLRTIYQFLC